MISYSEDAELGIAELTVDGKVDRRSFGEVVARLGSLVRHHGRVGVLKHVVSFRGAPPAVLWDDVKFAFRHLRHVGPVAVVTDREWVEIWTKLVAPFFEFEVRVFEEDELEEARAWLRRATVASRLAPVRG